MQHLSPALQGFSCLPLDLLHKLFDDAGVSLWLKCARVNRDLRDIRDLKMAAGHLSLSSCSGQATDAWLKWLLTRVPHGALVSLDISGCTELSKAGVARALKFTAHNLEEFHALHVGGASWSVSELQKLIDCCPSLRVLRANCRAKGITSVQLSLLTQDNGAVQPAKLVLHHGEGLLRGEAAQDEQVPPELAPPPLMPLPPPSLVAPFPPPAALESPAEVAAADADASARAGPAYLPPLGKALRRCTGSLKELDARGCLDVDGVAQVTGLLGAPNCTLQRLLLPGCGALRAADGMAEFAEALAVNKTVESLQLGCSYINTSGGCAIGAALSRNTSLLQLELTHNPLLDAGCTALGRGLAVNSCLRTLSLPFTGLGNGACDALAHALRSGSGLERLDLSGNALTADGAIALADAIPHGRLTSLALSANSRIGARGTLAIASAIPSTNLTSLSLDGCALGSAPCGRLAASLAASSIAFLDVSQNEISDEGAWELAWVLPECKALRELRLATDEIEEDGATELLTALLASPSLTSLDLRGNRFAQKGPTALALCETGRANVLFQRAAPWSPAA